MDRALTGFDGHIHGETVYTDPTTGRQCTAQNNSQLCRAPDSQIHQGAQGQQVDSRYTPVMW